MSRKHEAEAEGSSILETAVPEFFTDTDNWYPVDNVSKVFLATYTRRDSRSLRVSCVLNEAVDPQLLQQALEETIQVRPQFQVRIRRGLFWHYIEQTSERPVVREEKRRPCPTLYGTYYHGVLHYAVTYYLNRINVDLFHALTDGTGALEFLNILVLNYLKHKAPGDWDQVILHSGANADTLTQDSFRKFYNPSEKGLLDLPVPEMVHKAFHIRGARLPYDQLQFFEIHMSAAKVVALAKGCGVSLTSYMGAALMMALYKDMEAGQKRLPISISMPVNLRNFYPSETSRNFFNNVNIERHFTGAETLEELAVWFHQELQNAITPERIRAQMDRYQRMERVFLVRMVPLFIKMPVVRFFSRQEEKRVSAVISNLGVRQVPQEMKPYVKGYTAFCSHPEFFMTVSSYEDDLVLGVTSAYRSTGVLRSFIQNFTSKEIAVRVDSTDVVR